jgi:hypothetical protein
MSLKSYMSAQEAKGPRASCLTGRGRPGKRNQCQLTDNIFRNINPDAHATGEIGLIKYGISVARRGWLEKADIVNTQTAAKALKGVKR